MIVLKHALCGALDALEIGPNHALQRTAAGRRGLRRRASGPASLSLDRWVL